MRSERLYSLLACLVLALALGPVGSSAWLLGFVQGESPCVLCWAQRTGMALIALIGVISDGLLGTPGMDVEGALARLTVTPRREARAIVSTPLKPGEWQDEPPATAQIMRMPSVRGNVSDADSVKTGR